MFRILEWLRLLASLSLFETQDTCPKTEFKELEPRLKLNPRLKYGWFYLKLY